MKVIAGFVIPRSFTGRFSFRLATSSDCCGVNRNDGPEAFDRVHFAIALNVQAHDTIDTTHSRVNPATIRVVSLPSVNLPACAFPRWRSKGDTFRMGIKRFTSRHISPPSRQLPSCLTVEFARKPLPDSLPVSDCL